jgi:hypothetical protein
MGTNYLTELLATSDDTTWVHAQGTVMAALVLTSASAETGRCRLASWRETPRLSSPLGILA